MHLREDVDYGASNLGFQLKVSGEFLIEVTVVKYLWGRATRT